MNPFRYRPEEGGLDWEDRAGSNLLAWLSDTLLPRWCKSENHWTAKFAFYFWAECACCLFWRGGALGFMTGAALGAGLTSMFL